MGNPWGLTGPEFLQLYAVGLALALGLAVWVRLAGRRPEAEAVVQPGPLREIEFAYLTGGATRAVETAVAALLAGDGLRASRGGYVSGTGPLHLSDPVEREVRAYTGDTGRRTLALLVNRVATSEAVREVAERLVRRGLLVPPERLSGLGLRSAAGLIVLGVIGLFRAIEGGGEGFPIGYLVLLLILTGVLAAVVAWLPVCWRTQAGDQAVAAHPESISDSAAAVVARAGIAAYPEPRISDALLSHSAQVQVQRQLTAVRQSGRRRRGSNHTHDSSYHSAGYVAWSGGAAGGGHSGGDASGGGGWGGCGGGGGGCGGGGGS